MKLVRLLFPILLASAALGAFLIVLRQAQPAYAQGSGPGCTFTFGTPYESFFEDSVYPDEYGVIDYTHEFTIASSIIVARPRAINAPFSGMIGITGCGSINFSTPIAPPYIVCCVQTITCGGVVYSAQQICDMAYTPYSYTNNLTGFDLGDPLGPSAVNISANALDQSGWPLVYYLYGQSYTTTEIPATVMPQHLIQLSSGETFEVKYEWSFGDIAIVSILIVIATILVVKLVYDVVRNVWFSLRMD